MTKTIRIGSGAGYAGDRLEPSLELIEKGNLDYISAMSAWPSAPSPSGSRPS